MSGVFPYGNDPGRPDDWVGRMPTKSKRWLVSYDGGLSIVCGYHSFIFLGLESLNIAVVNLLGCGISVSRNTGRLSKALGAPASTAKRIGDAQDKIDLGSDSYQTVNSELEQEAADTGMGLFQRMRKAIPQLMIAEKPFSLEDLAGMPAGIGGGEIELIANAAVYWIEGYDGVTGGLTGHKIFQTHVANTGEGLVGAGVSLSAGLWSVERWHNLYFELGASSQIQCQRENRSPVYDQPYMSISNLHPWLARLPPAGCAPSQTGFNPAAAFQSGDYAQ